MPTHDHNHEQKNGILVAFVLNLLFATAELIGGVLFSSVALYSDALHDFGDSLSLGLAAFFERKADSAEDPLFTYGYGRYRLLSAAITGAVLFAGGLFVLTEAIPRLFEPGDPNAYGMTGFAVVALVVNGFAAYRTSRGKGLNDRMVTWHLLEDFFGAGALLVSSLLIQWTGSGIFDPLFSILITLVIFHRVYQNGREVFHLFMQGVPPAFSIEQIEKMLREIPGVRTFHHLHLWSLDSNHHVLSVHVVIESCEKPTGDRIKAQIREALAEQSITHCTIEVECVDDECGLS